MEMTKSLVFGASGFIGKHLMQVVDQAKYLPVSRSSLVHGLKADLLNFDSLLPILQQGRTVINLAYSHDVSWEDNIKMAKNLVKACLEANISKLIHCSTALVIGNNPVAKVDENTQCFPESLYEKNKHTIEEIFLAAANNHLEVVILRPTGVIGPGGKNLKKMLTEISHGHPIVNFMRSSLYGNRPLNLVPVQDVVNALLYLNENSASGVYICAADEDPANQYNYIENLMRTVLNKPYRIKPCKFPLIFLESLLRITRSGSSRFVNRQYSSKKLCKLGFKSSISLSDAITEFVLAEKI